MTVKIDGIAGLTFADTSTQNVTALNASNITAGTLGKARLPSGSVLQVVQGFTATTVSTNTNGLITSGLTASITPTSSSSKILVMISLQGVGKGTNNTSLALWLYKNGSPILNFGVNNTAYSGDGSDNFPGGSAFNWLDSPATTSATTYAVFFGSASNLATVYLQVNSSTSTITLLEIAA